MEDSLQVKLSIILGALIIGTLGVAFCFDRGILDDHATVKRDETDFLVDKDSEIDISLNNSKFYKTYKALKDKTYMVERENGLSSFSYEDRMGIVAKELKKSDFKKTDKVFNETDGHKNYFYNLSRSKVINILKKYFGKEAFVEGKDLVNDMVMYPLSISYSEGSKMIITDFDEKTDMYEVRFTGSKSNQYSWIENRKITSAKLKNKVITVVEKVFYYDYTEGENKAVVRIYSDREKTKLLDAITDTEKNLKKKEIKMDNYIKEATTITHTYEYNEEDNDYYFSSSKIS